VRTRLRSIDAGQIAVVCGLIFIPAGLVKFAFYHWELHAFRDFGIPAATVLEPLVGALETLGGVFLALRLLVVPTAFVLAVIMLVAFISGGIIHGDAIPSDTLAPALLAAMIYLVWKGLTASSSRP
jgi:putative oxidoreductase